MTTKAKETRAALTLIAALAVSTMAFAQDPYRGKIAKFRAEREAELKAEDGWLSVSGLFWLKEGENPFGADPSNDIVLPKGSAPPRAGVFELQDGKTTLRVAGGAEVTLEGKPVSTLVMNTGADHKPDVIRLGALLLNVIKRGERFGVRVKDSNAKHRRQFKGLRWFPVKEAYRITARFVV